MLNVIGPLGGWMPTERSKGQTLSNHWATLPIYARHHKCRAVDRRGQATLLTSHLHGDRDPHYEN